jgi:DNA polymerase-1
VEEPGRGPLLLLDGMSLAFRAWFALPPDLATTDGTVTNAVHGFTGMLLYLIRDHRPSALAVAFDLPGPTFRDDLVAEYKAGRSETPDDLLPQFGLIRELLGTLAVPVVEMPGFEADDVLATLATEARDRGTDVIVVTGDRDCFQLVEDPHVRVLYNRRGVRDYALYDEAGIVERCGVPPATYPALAALRGDTSDNLPGVPGVGEKTAAKLLTTYGDLEGIFAHLEDLTPKLRANLTDAQDQVRSNFSVIPLVRDVTLPVSVGDLTLGGWDPAEIEALFDRLELKTQWGRLLPLLREGALGSSRPGAPPLPGGATAGETAPVPGPSVPPEAVVVDAEVALDRPTDEAAAVAALGRLEAGAGPVALVGRFVGDPGRSPLEGLVLVGGSADPPTGVWLERSRLDEEPVRAALGAVCARPVVGHEVKEVLRTLLPGGLDVVGLVMDTAVAAYLLDPSTGDYSLDAVAEAAGLVRPEGVEGSAPPDQLPLGGESDPAPGAAADALVVARAEPVLRRRLVEDGLGHLHDVVECPLVRVLARMEVAGIRVDAAELRRIADELVGECDRLEERIQEFAGHEFNVNSTPQLRTVLFEELGLPPGRKTKTGYSTDANTLEGLRGQHDIIGALLEYREVEKLRSTYGESLLAEVAEDGRIHASFRQTVARTGRLSSDRPNLHNIPVRTEAGRRFRRAFIPAEGMCFLVADYDQVELRVIAHLSGDPGLVEAFTTGADIHRTVAAGVYGVAPGEVTKAQRDRAKMVSYGLAYGMEAYGLSQRLATSVEEASEIVARYFGAFPQVRQYMEGTVAEARDRGFTRTELGRKRPLPELSDRNWRVRQAAERQAMNAGIQGLAADLFKTALVRLEAAFEAAHLESRLVLQVHDEVIIEGAPGEEQVVEELTARSLTAAAELSVPLEVSMAWGDSWDDAKGG